jgi:hypothetical protein
MKTQKADTDIFTAVIASDVIGYLWVVKWRCQYVILYKRRMIRWLMNN